MQAVIEELNKATADSLARVPAVALRALREPNLGPSMSAIVAKMADQKIPEKVNADKFDAILRRMVEHRPVPKKKVKASRKRKLSKVISR